MNGIIIESEIQATDVVALNKYAVCAGSDVAGGGLVSLAPSGTQGNDVFTATVPAAGTLGGLYVAYNPSEWLTQVGTGATAKYFAGLSDDPRDYTNLATRTFTCFKPQVGDEVTFSVDCVATAGQNLAVAGDILESVAGATTLARIASATGATAGSTAFRIDWVGTLPFPQAGVGQSFYKAFKCTCVQQ